MEIHGKRKLPLPPGQAWEALNAVPMLSACIPGCESVVRSDDNCFDVVQTLRVGQFETRFSSTLTLEDVDPPHSYVLRFSGYGGEGGFGVGHVLAALQPLDDGSQLTWDGDVEIGGRLARLGQAVVEREVLALTEDFFTRFERSLRGAPAVERPGLAERVWSMAPPWAWALSTLVVVFAGYTGLHLAW